VVPIRTPDAGTFESKLGEARVAVADLVRLSRFPDTEPYWGRSASSRFDDPLTKRSNEFGVCYASDSLAVAFAETVIHGSSHFMGGRYVVAARDLTGRSVVRFKHPHRRELLLADLTGEGLKSVGLNNDISAGDDYTLPQFWAQAIHRANTKWDGIRYVSRQYNRGFAVALFDRCSLVKASTERLEGMALQLLCDQFDVVAI
jgi:hypothetical protein